VSALERILEGEIVTDVVQIAADGTCPAEVERDAVACLFEDNDPVRVLADWMTRSNRSATTARLPSHVFARIDGVMIVGSNWAILAQFLAMSRSHRSR
jgi:hypothetical protein